MRIYAASRSDVVKGALYMIGFVVVLDVAMVLFLEHVVHRTVTVTAQWPIGLLLLGVIAYTIRALNQASSSWIRLTPKQLSWASGPRPVSQGLTPSGSVKLSELTAVSVQSDEIKVKSGRKLVTLNVHRLHAEVEGKPTIVLPIAALESADDKYAAEALEQGRALLLRAVAQINENVTGFTVDTSVMGDVVLPGDEAKAEAAQTAVDVASGEESAAENALAAEYQAVVPEAIVPETVAAEAGAADGDEVVESAKAGVIEAEAVEAEPEVEAAPEVPSVPAGSSVVEAEPEAEAELEVPSVPAESSVVGVEPEVEAAPEVPSLAAGSSVVEAEPEAEAAPEVPSVPAKSSAAKAETEAAGEEPAAVIPAATKSPEAETTTAESTTAEGAVSS